MVENLSVLAIMSELSDTVVFNHALSTWMDGLSDPMVVPGVGGVLPEREPSFFWLNVQMRYEVTCTPREETGRTQDWSHSKPYKHDMRVTGQTDSRCTAMRGAIRTQVSPH